MAAERRRSVRGWARIGRGWLAEMSDALVSVFLPSGCRICERLLTRASRVPLCEECLSSFEKVPNIVCEVCGRPLPGLARKEGEPLLCPACQDRTYAFDRARSFAVYEGAVVRAIVLLMRTRPRPEMQVLSLEELWESVRGAFGTRPGSQVDNLRVLLVYDVLTTGATLDACARALREAGAKSVMGLTVARAVRNPLPSTGAW